MGLLRMLVVCFLLFSAAFAVANNEFSGDKTLRLTYVTAYYPNGSIGDQKQIEACNNKFKRLLKDNVLFHYEIHPTTLFETATATFAGRKIQLYPLGITGKYYFMSDGVGDLGLLHIKNIIFSISKDTASARGSVSFHNDNNMTCELSSQPY